MTVAAQIETTFREEHGRILVALISQFEDFTLAEDALTLHTLGGLSTPEDARAFLVPVPTMAQRLARAITAGCQRHRRRTPTTTSSGCYNYLSRDPMESCL